MSTSTDANPPEVNDEEAKQPAAADNGSRRMNDPTKPAFRIFHKQK